MPEIMKVRRQGGARIVTLPNAVLSRVGADTGTPLAFDVKGGSIVATPVTEAGRRKRYRLSELLEGSEGMAELNRATAWALEGDGVGNELA